MNLRANPPELSLSGPELAGLLNDVLQKGAALRFKAAGYSMTPFIKHGDVITVSPCSSTTLRPGDIAAFTDDSGNRLIIHRIVGTRGASFFIKGDNARNPDGLIPGARILGSVTKIERGDRSLQFGLGFERKVIALLSRLRILPFALIPARHLYRLWIPQKPPA
jgi:signal peptidase I